MKNKKAARSKSQEQHVNIVPDISIIDLSNPSAEEDTAAQEPEPDEDEDSSGISMHKIFIITLLALFAVLILGLVYKFLTWGKVVDLDELFKNGLGSKDTSMYDLMLPLMDSEHQPVYKNYAEDTTILFLGNSPFSDDRESSDNVVNMIQKIGRASCRERV